MPQLPPSAQARATTSSGLVEEGGKKQEDRLSDVFQFSPSGRVRVAGEISRCSTTLVGLGSFDEFDLKPPELDESPCNHNNDAISHESGLAKESGDRTRLDMQQLQTDISEAWKNSNNNTLDFGRFLEVSAPVLEKYELGPSTPTRKSAAVIQNVFQTLVDSVTIEDSAQVVGGATSSTNSGLLLIERPRDRYVLLGELLGGGATGVVEKAFDPVNGRDVAIKRLQRDTRCPIRFLELHPTCQNGVNPWPQIVHLEGYAAAGSRAVPCSGSLFFDSLNPYGKDPFQSSASACIVLVWRGGGVPFAEKVYHAYRGGAVGVIIINSNDYTEEYAVGDASKNRLPSMLISRSDGETVLNLLSASETLTDFAAARSSTQTAPPLTLRRCFSAEMRTDAEHEVAICRRIPPHPQVIRILDTWDENGMPVLVTEICTGGKLPRSSEFNSDTSIALWLLSQMLAGISHLHEHGVCHRDLKPENLLMTRPLGDPGARLVIIDFGMAGLSPHMSVPCGSARYLAPEVIDGQYGLPRDVWVSGVVGYELLWGEHPFARNFLSDVKVIEAVRTSEISIPPNSRLCSIPESACDLLRRLLQKDPRIRPTAACALKHSIFQDIEVPGWNDSELKV